MPFKCKPFFSSPGPGGTGFCLNKSGLFFLQSLRVDLENNCSTCVHFYKSVSYFCTFVSSQSWTWRDCVNKSGSSFFTLDFKLFFNN